MAAYAGVVSAICGFNADKIACVFVDGSFELVRTLSTGYFNASVMSLPYLMKNRRYI